MKVPKFEIVQSRFCANHFDYFSSDSIMLFLYVDLEVFNHPPTQKVLCESFRLL
jgi:hypothetical protein